MRKLIKKCLPATAVVKLRHVREASRLKIISVFAANGFLSSVFYTFFSASFYREHRAVLQGRVAYWKRLHIIDHSSALLRRNIHRLEKGLVMEPRRPVFGESFIAETVECYKNAVRSSTLCSEERKWATDVLREYFGVVGDTEAIARERAAFLKSMPVPGDEMEKYRPYKHTILPQAPVTYDQLAVLFQRRRSVRWFEDKAVPLESIKKAIDLAATAPSACNRQPFKFYVTAQPPKAVEVAKVAMGTRGYAENIPSIVAVVGELDAYPFERDRHVIYIDGALVSMQFMLALETLGLSSCPINWPDIEERERRLEELLELSPYQRPIMLLAVGYAKPDGGIPYSQKKGAELLTREIG